MVYMAKKISNVTKYGWVPVDLSDQWDSLIDALTPKCPPLGKGDIMAAAMVHFMMMTEAQQIAAIRLLKARPWDEAVTKAEALSDHTAAQPIERSRSSKRRGKTG